MYISADAERLVLRTVLVHHTTALPLPSYGPRLLHRVPSFETELQGLLQKGATGYPESFIPRGISIQYNAEHPVAHLRIQLYADNQR